NPVVAGLLVALAAAALGLLGGGAWFTWRLDQALGKAVDIAGQEERARKDADEQRGLAEQRLEDVRRAEALARKETTKTRVALERVDEQRGLAERRLEDVRRAEALARAETDKTRA